MEFIVKPEEDSIFNICCSCHKTAKILYFLSKLLDFIEKLPTKIANKGKIIKEYYRCEY
jgi:hypothetical protein